MADGSEPSDELRGVENGVENNMESGVENGENRPVFPLGLSTPPLGT